MTTTLDIVVSSELLVSITSPSFGAIHVYMLESLVSITPPSFVALYLPVSELTKCLLLLSWCDQ